MWRGKCRKHKPIFHTTPMSLSPALSAPTTCVPRLTVLRKSWAVPVPHTHVHRAQQLSAQRYTPAAAPPTTGPASQSLFIRKIANHHHPLLGPNRRPFHPRLRLSYYVVDTPGWEELPISPGHTTMRPRPPTNVVKQENTHNVLLLGLAPSEAMMDNRS